ncbi:endonuclease domain-containing protein [Mesorhizobium sp. VNQ89]|uniref:endonuclease domain-containing protein n=1 Tax=Mesorhizobium quangtriensis TaxID=3157709 RepID=UPI0032B86EE3
MQEGSRTRRRSGATTRARQLRLGDNMSEALLWNELKDRRLCGFKFVRQCPIGPFIADFLCRQHKLVVEVDGSQHAESETDRRREEYMREKGYATLRFWNTDVITNIEPVCETILAALTGKLNGDVESFEMRFVGVSANPNDKR